MHLLQSTSSNSPWYVGLAGRMPEKAGTTGGDQEVSSSKVHPEGLASSQETQCGKEEEEEREEEGQEESRSSKQEPVTEGLPGLHLAKACSLPVKVGCNTSRRFYTRCRN